MARRGKDRDAFGAALEEQLARHSLRKTDLARASGVTTAYISKLANSTSPSPQWVDIIAGNTNASPREHVQLYAAAADSAGYKIMDYVKYLEARVVDLERKLEEK